MAEKGKRKDKMKLKNHETEFNNKLIDLKNFAYDVIKYSALKFHLPESCITVWKSSVNDYGCNDFFLVLSSEIFRYQIMNRYQYRIYFIRHYKLNKLASSQLIVRLLEDVVDKTIEEPSTTPLQMVEISLSVVCELFLFLYSETGNLNPKPLATCWFQFYLSINKLFEEAGGLTEMYLQASRTKFDDMDAFFSNFIVDHCLPYKPSAKNPRLKEIYYQYNDERKRKAAESLSPEDCEETKKILERTKDMSKRPPAHLKRNIGKTAAVKPPKPVGTSRVVPTKNARLGIIPHNDLISFYYGSSVASSKDPPSITPEEQPQPHRTLFLKRRMRIKNAILRAGVKQGLDQPSSDSSDAKQSRERKPIISVAKDTTPSYNRLGDKPKTPVENGRSSALQKGIPSSRSSVEQSLGQPSSDSSGTKHSSNTKPSGSEAKNATQSYSLPGTKPKILVEHEGSCASKTDALSCPNIEQGFQQLSLDSSGAKQSREKNLCSASIAKDATPSNNNLESGHKIPVEDTNGCGMKESRGQYILDSSESKKSDVLTADDLTSRSHPDATHQELNKEHKESSSQEEKEKRKS